jgi:uncharacterized protein YqgC (DUF456 family)
MFSWLLKIGRVIAGVALVIVGFAALVTPLTPGAWLIFVGLEMLGWRVAYGRYIHDFRSWLRSRISRSPEDTGADRPHSL